MPKWAIHLATVDPVMKRLIAENKLKPGRVADNPFRELVEAIISQQLSVKAADTIMRRFCGIYGDDFPTPTKVLTTRTPRIRACGVSGAKAQYIKNVAKAFVVGHLNREHLMAMSDQEVFEKLVAIKGVGPWTAQMFLMFALARPDVFSFGDVGLQNAIKRQYGKQPTTKTMARLSAVWAPWRTWAARLLWASLRNT